MMSIVKAAIKSGFYSMTGVFIAIVLTYHFLGLTAHPFIEQLFLVGIPAAAVAVLLFLTFDRIWQFFTDIQGRTQAGLAGISAAMAICMTVLGERNMDFGMMAVVTFIVFWILSFLFLIPTARALDLASASGGLVILMAAAFCVSVFNFFLFGSFGNFYSQVWQPFLVTLFADSGIILLFYGLFCVGRKYGRLETFIILVFLTVSLFLAWQNYSVQIILQPVDPISIACMSALLGLSLGPWLTWLFDHLRNESVWNFLRGDQIAAFLVRYDRVLIMAILFFASYFSLANVLNLERYGGDDMFFDSDAETWRTRLATSAWADPYGRSMHPLTLLILRPLVAFIGQFILGSVELAALFLTVLAGTGCVVLMWLIVNEATQNETYALIAAAVFGLSTTQLMFSSLVETYIFSAFLLLLFVFFLQRGKPLWMLVVVGVATMGITVSNLIQNLMVVFAFKPVIKTFVRFAALVVSIVVLLSIVNNIVYPGVSPLFFVPTTVRTEATNLHGISADRIQLAVRELFIYSEVAPNPIVLTKLTVYPRFWFFTSVLNQRKQPIDYISTYETVPGTGVAYIWLALIALALFFFFKKLIHQRSLSSLSVSLILILAFNFAFHLLYGNELFLYTPHLFYAFILFLFLAFSDLLEKRWFLPVLTIVLVLVTANNLFFLYSMIDILKSAIVRAGV